jgi:2-phospho-L-lactate transferase/gluconeogenesis factor (CofD/UPF0052 family)
MTQPGETDRYTARQHLETVKKYAPEIHFDFVVVNSRPINEEQRLLYAAEGANQIGIHEDSIREALSGETEIVHADLLDEGEKVRHSSERLARVVMACREEAVSRTISA